jgi:hypothetical protein
MTEAEEEGGRVLTPVYTVAACNGCRGSTASAIFCPMLTWMGLPSRGTENDTLPG